MRETLTDIGKGYTVVNPITIEVTASLDEGLSLYWACAVNLQNELIFGVGRTKSFAIQMLKESLTSYYDELMSSDFDSLDKTILQRSVLCEHS